MTVQRWTDEMLDELASSIEEMKKEKMKKKKPAGFGESIQALRDSAIALSVLTMTSRIS